MAALAAAMEKAGVDAFRLRLETLTLCRSFMSSGGTLNLWNEIGAEVAKEMVERSHPPRVSDDHIRPAPLHQPKPDEGHSPNAHEGQVAVVDVRYPTPEGQIPGVREDQSANADGQPIASGEAVSTVPEKANKPPPPPAREPSQADLDSMEKAANIAYFQMIKLRNKAWTVYRFKDLPQVRAVNTRENMVINDVIDWGRKNRIPDDRLVWTSIPQREMRAIIKRAEGALLHHAKLTVKPATQSGRNRGHG